jgi:hypothetical protein
LEKAVKWLRASEYISYNCRPNEVSIRLSTGEHVPGDDTVLSLR